MSGKSPYSPLCIFTRIRHARPPWMSSKQIEHFLQKLCDTTFEGGRVVTNGPDTVILYDVPTWPGVRTDALRQRFPHCDVDVQQAPHTSASGFAVIVTTRDPVSYLRVGCAVLVSLVAAVLTGAAAMSVFLSEHQDWGNVNFYTHHNDSCVLNETAY
jgi:hypothetical protein